MSFSFGGGNNPPSSGASNPSTSAPAAGSLFAATGSTPTFSFGPAPGASSSGAGATGGSTSLFGGSGPSGGASNTLFGSTSTSSGGGGLFGGAAAKPATSSNIFGGSSTTPAVSGPSSQQAFPPGGLFGAKSTTPQSTTPAGPTPNTSGIFGQSTPAKPTTALPSTTPAGAPPATVTAAAGGGLFGASTGTQPGRPLFGSGTTSTTPAVGGGGLFGAKPASSMPTITASQPTATPAAPTGLFGSTTAAPASSTTPAPAAGGLFGAKPATTGTTGGGLFGATSQPATGLSTPTAGAGGGLFGGTAAATTASAAPSTLATAAPAGQSSLFGAKPATTIAPSSTSATTAPSTAGSLFGAGTSATATTPAAGGGLFGGKPATSTPAATTATPSTAPAASTAAKPLFGAAPTASTSTPATTAATTTTTATPAASSLFGGKQATTTATPSTTAPTTSMTATTGASTTAASGGLFSKPADANKNLSASTTGPTSQLPRLKNKTMDEIITRWASDLQKYQKEFKEQATKVAAWDRLLVDNGDKIQKLYLATFEASKASGEIERQLVQVESQQSELEAWLDKYEGEVNDMFTKQMGTSSGDGSGLTGPDQERERTYKMAEQLTERLDEMGKDLSKMIKEVNDISGGLSKSGKNDDPLSQIVRVLNGHLSQLQWIDQNTAALQVKVQAAQKATAGLGSQFGAPETDAADGFMKSYMGRR